MRICDYFDITADYLLGRTLNSKYYKEIELDVSSEKLLYYYRKLPEQAKIDVLRYTKFILMDMKEDEEKS